MVLYSQIRITLSRKFFGNQKNLTRFRRVARTTHKSVCSTPEKAVLMVEAAIRRGGKMALSGLRTRAPNPVRILMDSKTERPSLWPEDGAASTRPGGVWSTRRPVHCLASLPGIFTLAFAACVAECEW
jgi:hypothetical protein